MVYGEMRQTAQDVAADRLLTLLPETLDAVYFVNSGAEAIDAAMKLVRRVTHRSKILAVEGGYHGNTFGALSGEYQCRTQSAIRSLVGDIELIPWNDMEGLEAIDASVAGIIVETVQGDAGIRIPDTEWLRTIRDKCTQTGAHLVLDEIQCGFGRTGRPFEHFGLSPTTCAWAKHWVVECQMGAPVEQGGICSNLHILLPWVTSRRSEATPFLVLHRQQPALAPIN